MQLYFKRINRSILYNLIPNKNYILDNYISGVIPNTCSGAQNPMNQLNQLYFKLKSVKLTIKEMSKVVRNFPF